VVIPARPGKPKDKATVESAVLAAQRWILARLRHQAFFSLAETNRAIWALLEALNDRPMQQLGISPRLPPLLGRRERHPQAPQAQSLPLSPKGESDVRFTIVTR